MNRNGLFRRTGGVVLAGLMAVVFFGPVMAHGAVSDTGAGKDFFEGSSAKEDCDDHNACSIDMSDPMGGCWYILNDCNDNNPSTIDTCNPAIGCIHTIPPHIADVSPSQGPNGGGIEITIHGTGFVPNGTTQVLFHETPATNVQLYWEGNGSYYITCILPAHLPCAVDVTVINPDGGRVTKAAAFTYLKNHPADLDNDWKIRIGEAIAYLYGWQQGSNPIGHAIRAAYLWQYGEVYTYYADEDPPMCWILPEPVMGGITFCWIPPGSFLMGRYPGEQDSWEWEDPQHEVAFAQGFWMSKYEITQAQWRAVMGTNPSYFTGDNRPVENLSWDMIRQTNGYLDTLNAAHPGYGFRLPTEAEWEYACRAGTATRFYWGDDPYYMFMDIYAWYWDNSSDGTQEVGKKRRNAWGLHDMSGNVWEWCEDDWHGDYIGAPEDGSAWVDSPRTASRVARGGSCIEAEFGSRHLRSANRVGGNPGNRDLNTGFRVVVFPASR